MCKKHQCFFFLCSKNFDDSFIENKRGKNVLNMSDRVEWLYDIMTLCLSHNLKHVLLSTSIVTKLRKITCSNPCIQITSNTTNIFTIVIFINWSMTADFRRQKMLS